MIAIRLRKYLIAMALIRSGCEISKPDVEGFTPLHHAARNNDVKAVKLLLDCGLRYSKFQSPKGWVLGRDIPSPIMTYITNYK